MSSEKERHKQITLLQQGKGSVSGGGPQEQSPGSSDPRRCQERAEKLRQKRRKRNQNRVC